MKTIQINDQKANETNQVKPESTVSENAPAEKVLFTEASIKEMMSQKEIQEALRRRYYVPEEVVVKEVRKAFQAEGAEHKTQKIEGISGTTIEDAVSYELTLVDIELKDEAINKKYRIVDYTFALEANMSGGRFTGYAAKGLKLMVTKLEKV